MWTLNTPQKSGWYWHRNNSYSKPVPTRVWANPNGLSISYGEWWSIRIDEPDKGPREGLDVSLTIKEPQEEIT